MRGRVGGQITTAVVATLIVLLVAIGWLNRSTFTAAQVGAEAPDFTLPTPAGDSITLSQYRGQVVLLNFWATWCTPCVKEMPAMQRLYADLRDRGFTVLAVNVDVLPAVNDSTGAGVDVSGFARRLGATFPIALDPDEHVQDVYVVTGLPTSYVIGRDGKVQGRVVGGRMWDSDEYRRRIVDLLGD